MFLYNNYVRSYFFKIFDILTSSEKKTNKERNIQKTEYIFFLMEEPTGKCSMSLWNSRSVCFNGHFSRWTWVCQSVSILDFIGAKDDGGGGELEL